MRRRKFIAQIETCMKHSNSIQTREQNEINKLTLKEKEKNNDITQLENESEDDTTVNHINKSTSTMGKQNSNHAIKISKDNQSNNVPIEQPTKTKSKWNTVGENVEKPLHKIKVRNQKHKTFSSEYVSKYRKSVGTCTRRSREIKDKSNEYQNSCKAMCRICHGGDTSSEFGELISACSCRGTIGRVHVVCLETWLTESGKSSCELCSTSYSIRRIHKYGILKALTIWLFSQNSKQLMIDMLGTVLMMPLAILAAWLSGSTLLNLMAQEDEMAAWPLVSSFMLSCTTLVCYYCWIVSAATRHAISWWIWYQSQYQVKLLFATDHETDECTTECS